ncbi:sigma-70 family RNA polymerase sigma factor [Kordiimonas lacus]|uniref:RNA polymerase sigma-70 factor, ECF subfamily n=1 Tax=Kordiimonas lacus TaxID=637679 RepID=A0A1G7ABF3_9PROT|nr:sigma-70 family RNA polymerase sigma factor [Kordiimonas lacus]SDE12003.1 RNA polymerase sigma-70 factor, ECF subfamily [Kordiimonas lacus]
MNTTKTDLKAALETEFPHLRRYAQSLTRDRSDAEDLAQAAIVRALTRAHQFKAGTNLRGWLFTILKNIHIDRQRKAARQGPKVAYEDWYQETQCAPTQEKHIEMSEVADRLQDLKKDQQKVIKLSVFDGLDHQEIAKKMNVAVGTVKSRLCRARRALAVN